MLIKTNMYVDCSNMYYVLLISLAIICDQQCSTIEPVIQPSNG